MPFKSEKQRRYLFANEPEVAKKFAQDYNMGGVASMFRKRLAEGDDPFYEAWKKVYEQNPDAAAMNENHDEYLEKYKLEMSMQTSDAPIEEIEETTEVVEETKDPLLNLFQPTDSLNTEQAITTLFTPERPEGIMAAKGGRVALKGGGMDASTSSFSESYDKAVGNPPGTTKGNPDSDRREKEGQDEADRINRQIEIRQDIKSRDEEKYDTDLEGMKEKDKYRARRNAIKTKFTSTSKQRFNALKDNFNTEKNRLEKEFKKEIGKKVLLSMITGGVSLGLSDAYNLGKDIYEIETLKNEYKSDLESTKEDLKALGVPDFTPHTDTLTQTIDQELIDITKKDDPEKEKEKDGPLQPVTLEVDEQYAQGEMLDFNMMSALDKIRQNQAVRSGLVERGIIQDNEPMLANKGGLAGLFRVKNQ